MISLVLKYWLEKEKQEVWNSYATQQCAKLFLSSLRLNRPEHHAASDRFQRWAWPWCKTPFRRCRATSSEFFRSSAGPLAFVTAGCRRSRRRRWCVSSAAVRGGVRWWVGGWRSLLLVEGAGLESSSESSRKLSYFMNSPFFLVSYGLHRWSRFFLQRRPERWRLWNA